MRVVSPASYVWSTTGGSVERQVTESRIASGEKFGIVCGTGSSTRSGGLKGRELSSPEPRSKLAFRSARLCRGRSASPSRDSRGGYPTWIVHGAWLRLRSTAEAAISTWVVPGVRVPFRVVAKYFSSGFGGGLDGSGDSASLNAKARWMQEFHTTTNTAGTWPTGCYSMSNR